MKNETLTLETREKGVLTISRVFPDGSLVETVLGDSGTSTKLVASGTDILQLVDECRAPTGELLIPLRASHGFIKHKVVLLPGAPREYGSREELVREIEGYIARYLTLSSTFLKLSAHYVLLSWVYDVFAEVPYLRFKGDFGSGKTRALRVVGSITYKPIFASGASTVSPIFHALDLFRGTLIFDEADFRFTDERAEVTKIFNSGTTRGFPVLRASVGDKKDFDPRAFEVFGPKIVGMREVFEDIALESRFFTETMSGQADPGVPINLPDSQEEKASELRSKLLMFRLKERGSVALDASVIDPSLSARSNQLLAPLLSLVADEETREKIRTLLRQQEADQAADRSNQVEALVLDSLLLLSVTQPWRTHFSLAEIRVEALKRHSGEFDRPLTSRYLGSLIRNKLGLRSHKSGVYMVRVPSQEEKETLIRRFGLRQTSDK